MAHRKEQVESLLQRAVAQTLQRGLSDPRIKGLVSVTAVEASPDLKHATVHVSIVPEQYESRTMHGLRDATGHIQNRVKKQVALRLVPRLEFKLDKSLKKQAEVLAAIDQGLRRTASRPTGDDAPPCDASRHDNDNDQGPAQPPSSDPSTSRET